MTEVAKDSVENFETPDYILSIGVHEDLPIYQVVNKVTGVMEYQDYLLPRAIESLQAMQKQLIEVRDRFNGPDVPKLSLLDGGNDDETGGLH
jgi:hypothetical protein